MGIAEAFRRASSAGLLIGLAACGAQSVPDQPSAPALDRMAASMAIRPVVEKYVPAAQAGVVSDCVAQTAPAADISNFLRMGAAFDTQTRRILELIKAPAANDCIAKQLL